MGRTVGWDVPDPLQPKYHQYDLRAHRGGLAASPLRVAARDRDVRVRSRQSSPLRRGSPVGKSPTQVRSDGKRPTESEFYDKWIQAIASATQLAELGAKRQVANTAVFTFVMPILLVADKTIWVGPLISTLHGAVGFLTLPRLLRGLTMPCLRRGTAPRSASTHTAGCGWSRCLSA